MPLPGAASGCTSLAAPSSTERLTGKRLGNLGHKAREGGTHTEGGKREGLGATWRRGTEANHFEMRKVDLCSVTEGTEVILATSSDEKHPPENIIDGNPETFWTTTGMFPQEFIICFHKHVKIEKLVIQSYLVRTLRIEKTTSKEPLDFEQWVEKDLVHTEGQLQNEEIVARDGYATFLRFIIVSAFDHFASVHSISAEGLTVSSLP